MLIPFVKWLAKTRLFKKVGSALYDKFEKKSESVEKNGSDLKKMLGVFTFVAVPLPLTGVWTGSAVASILKIGFVKSLIGVIAGNAVACGIITLITYLFKDYVTWITLAFFIIAVLVVLFLIIKLIIYKPSDAQNGANADNDNSDSSLQ